MKGYLFLRGVSSYVGRAVVLLFFVSTLLYFFYALGSSQQFLDSTQLLLLGLLRVTLWLDIAVGTSYAGFLLYRCLSEHRPYVMRWILLLASLLISSALLVTLKFVLQWLHS